MYNYYNEKILIPLPQEILDRLSKKSLKELKSIIETYNEQGFVRFNEEYEKQNKGYSHQSGVEMMRNGLFVGLNKEDYDTIHHMTRLVLERNNNRKLTEELKNNKLELEKLKESIKNLKDFLK